MPNVAILVLIAVAALGLVILAVGRTSVEFIDKPEPLALVVFGRENPGHWAGRNGQVAYRLALNEHLCGFMVVHRDTLYSYGVTVRTLFRDGSGLELVCEPISPRGAVVVARGFVSDGVMQIVSCDPKQDWAPGTELILMPASDPDSLDRRLERELLRLSQSEVSSTARSIESVEASKPSFRNAEYVNTLVEKTHESYSYQVRLDAILRLSELPVVFAPAIVRLTEIVETKDEAHEARKQAATSIGVLGARAERQALLATSATLGDVDEALQRAGSALRTVLRNDRSDLVRIAVIKSLRSREEWLTNAMPVLREIAASEDKGARLLDTATKALDSMRD